MAKRTLIVVEGKSDKAFLESFLPFEIVVTNGSDVPRETIDYLKQCSFSSKIIVLCDPDAPGKRIRKILDEEVTGLHHAYVDKEFCIRKHKVGIAESDKEHILEALKNINLESTSPSNIWSMKELRELDLTGSSNASENRRIIERHFHLGYNNAKSLIKRLNNCSISIEQVKEVLKGSESNE